MRIAALLLVIAACADAEPAAPDARRPIDADPGGPLRILVVDEVAAAGKPDDWFAVVNASPAPVRLADFVFVDTKGKLARAIAFPTERVLAPGERYVQPVTDKVAGFKLGSDEELWIYRKADGRLSDGVDWPEGASPAGGSYRP